MNSIIAVHYRTSMKHHFSENPNPPRATNGGVRHSRTRPHDDTKATTNDDADRWRMSLDARQNDNK